MADKLTPENKKLAKMIQKIGSIDKKPAKAVKKADGKTAMGQSAKSHQKDLVKVAGATASRNPKSKSVDVRIAKTVKGMKSAEKSFKKVK